MQSTKTLFRVESSGIATNPPRPAAFATCVLCRTELLNLGSDSEFLAKLFGIRKALNVVLADARNKEFLKASGKQLVADFLVCCNHSPTEFASAFDEIVRFCGEESNWVTIEDELSHRGVSLTDVFETLVSKIKLHR